MTYANLRGGGPESGWNGDFVQVVGPGRGTKGKKQPRTNCLIGETKFV